MLHPSYMLQLICTKIKIQTQIGRGQEEKKAGGVEVGREQACIYKIF